MYDLKSVEKLIEDMFIEDQNFQKKLRNLLDIPEALWKEGHSMNLNHVKELKSIISNFGWENLENLRDKYKQQFWLLIQHADKDVDFQESCLNSMKIHGFSKENIAYLTDRVYLKKYGYQIYGTQFCVVDGIQKLRPVKDIVELPKLRLEMELTTLEENAKRMEEFYGLRVDITNIVDIPEKVI